MSGATYRMARDPVLGRVKDLESRSERNIPVDCAFGALAVSQQLVVLLQCPFYRWEHSSS